MRRLHEDRGQWLRTIKYINQQNYNKARCSGEVVGRSRDSDAIKDEFGGDSRL